MKIVFATNNHNKIIEIQSMLPKNIEILSLESINFQGDIEETALTIEGNAILKANYISQKYNCNCFADDTGLEVEVLNNEPGVFSARYAGNHKNSEDNMNKLLENLKNKPTRKARFKTIICLIFNNQQHLFEGICYGEITKQQSGNAGFGYDPIFRPDGFDKTFATLPLNTKNSISHRGIATAKLIEFLQQNHNLPSI